MSDALQPIGPEGRPTITIALLWHSLNSGNLGVGALTVADIAIARSVAEELGYTPRFIVMAARDDAPAAIQFPDVTSVPIDRRGLTSPDRLWRSFGEVDCAIDIGAGDSFADIYGPKRFAFMIATKLMAALRGKPLVFAPQTIGPFTKPGYKLPASLAMRRARAVMARDEQSLAVARAMAPGANVRLSVDVAFKLPFEDRSHLRGGPRLRVGVNASGLLFAEAERGSNRFGLSYDYARFIRALLAELSARDDIEVHLVPHATSDRDPTDDDGALAARLAAEFPGTVSAPSFRDPSAVKSYISGLDFLTAARMHACIAAYSANVPVVPIAYSRKFSGLFGLLGYDRMVPVQGCDVTAATAYVLAAIDQREQLAAMQREGLMKVDALLDSYREELRALFQDVVRARR